jgi:hypothetical protein
MEGELIGLESACAASQQGRLDLELFDIDRKVNSAEAARYGLVLVAE